MSALRDLLKLPTEKEIKTAVLDLIDQGLVIAIEGDSETTYSLHKCGHLLFLDSKTFR